MKLKLFLTIILSVLSFSLNACPKASDTTLSQQYNTGELQWQVARKEIDPNTLIHQAILENAPEVINFLLSHGVKVDYPDENGMSPLTVAILNNSTDAVKVLLEHGANTNPTVKWNNMSLLQLALSMKDAKSTKLLIQHGADVNVKDQSECALAKAINLRWEEIATLMIHKGANIHSDGPDCPLICAVYYSYNRTDRSLLKLFLEKGANINIVQKSNGIEYNTPLFAAINCADLALVKFLVESGADVNKGVRRGAETFTPLTQAIANGSSAIVQYLLQHGAKR